MSELRCDVIMVQLHLKRGDQSLFLVETSAGVLVRDLVRHVTAVYNGRLRVDRICSEVEELWKHGVTLAPSMQGLTEQQVEELGLLDEWVERCKQVQAGVCVTMEMVQEALDQLRGAVAIVYPMGLPPHDPIRMELEEKEELSGTQASLQVVSEAECQLWWAAKELLRDKKLHDYIGRNEKTKIVVKIQKVHLHSH
ncbi:hypothetical protein CRUP_024561 [Coryphaenoides rupestris]|nr:hypothetical protein CRUP_024561 [Coryphaenoides rupestris]